MGVAGPAPATGRLPSHGTAVPTRPLVRDQTHGIAFWPEHQFVLDSSTLGWHGVYTSLASEQPWQRQLPAVPHIALAYCVHGSARVRRAIGGERGGVDGTLGPRSFGMIPHDRDSRFTLDGRPDVQLVYLQRDLVDRVAGEAFGLSSSALELCFGVGVRDPLLEQLACALLASARDPAGDASALYADSIAHLMALHLLRHYQPHPRPARAPSAAHTPAQRRLQHVCDYIEAHLEEDLSLVRLAREAALSVHAFAPSFSRAMGVTPHAYVLRRRVERARRLLQGSDLPIAEVAQACGFSSQSHLSSAFKRQTGQTPAAYRG